VKVNLSAAGSCRLRKVPGLRLPICNQSARNDDLNIIIARDAVVPAALVTISRLPRAADRGGVAANTGSALIAWWIVNASP